MPALFEIVPLKSSIEDMPHPDSPYFIIASDGLYSRRTTAIGVVTQKEKAWPKHLKKADIKTATLLYTAPKLPKNLIERAWGFFKYALKENNSEAEVLILWNDSTKHYRLFAPHQECTYASVHSLYDPGDIPDGYQVIGSIHSHCDMDAFHSGTDTDDASDFNGVHITIGKVSDDSPDFATMVMMNGVQWDFDIEKIAEVSNRLTPRRFPNAWTSVFGTQEEILKREFKTLTKDDLKSWVDSLRPKTFISSRSSNSRAVTNWGTGWASPWADDDDPTSMDWWYRSQFGSGITSRKSDYKTKKYDDTQYSYETHGYVSKEWLNPTGSLKDAYVEMAFEQRLMELFDAAVLRGVWLEYHLSTMSPDELKNLKAVMDESGSMKKGSEFLPGPFSVKSDDDRDFSK